nr:reverse transcriptase domain-containing protein [Tanacetum cinerariifolium]
MDDVPMWAADRVVALTLDSAITILETESLTDDWLRIKEMLRNCHGHNLSKVFTRSGKSYDPPDNTNDQQDNSETPINFDSDDEDDEPTPQSKTQPLKPVKEMVIAENMLVEVGNFTFPANFVILKMEEDGKVLLILARPFLHTADAVIRVKQKQLNLRVGTERMIFNIDSAIKHSYSNDDTCFSIDVIDEILEEDFNALLTKEAKSSIPSKK